MWRRVQRAQPFLWQRLPGQRKGEKRMKLLLGVLLGFAIAGSPLLAGQEPGDKEKQKQEEPKKQEPQPKAHPDQKQEPAPSAKQEKQDEKQQQTDKQQQADQKQSKDQDKKARENNPPQAQSQNRQQNNRQQYGQESHERIPPQKFQADFGRDHHFRVKRLEQGRRFEYSGYSFELVQAWPADWSYDDECYIEQDADGYYLVDLIHPEVRVLVIVV